MAPMKQLRSWHAVVAVLATAAYLTEDFEPVHQLLGYGVAGLVVVRLLLAIFGAKTLGLQRYYPHFSDLKLGTIATNPAISRGLLLGIAISLIGVTTTGILMDEGKTLQSVPTGVAVFTMSGDVVSDYDTAGKGYSKADRLERDEDDDEGWLGDLHEMFANFLVGFVVLHVSYLVLFKWPLARFMLFVRQRKAPPHKTEM